MSCEKGRKMQLVTIDQHRHDILRKTPEDVKFPLDNKMKTIIQEFKNFFANLESYLSKPAGLAAVQVGIPFAFAIIQISSEAKKLRRNVYDILPPTLFINPTYQPIGNNKNKDWEACYSVPNKMGEINRFTEIEYSAYDENGKQFYGIAKGFFARVLQHEIGHLRGELFFDLISKNCRFGNFEEMNAIRKLEFDNMNK